MGLFSGISKGLIGTAVGSLAGPAGALFGGSIGSGMDNMDAQRESNERNAAQAAQQMAFQERMSSTAYERASKDLEKAGLNRILALGSPASSPAGAMANIEPVKNNINESGMNAASTLLNSQQIGSTVQKNSADADLATAKTAQAQAETVRTLRSEGIDKLKNKAGNAANNAITSITEMLGSTAKKQSAREKQIEKASERNRKKYFPTKAEKQKHKKYMEGVRKRLKATPNQGTF